MRIINLDQNFNPYGSWGELFINKFIFPSGIEPHVNVAGLDIKGVYEKQDVIITHRIKSMNDLMEIVLLNNALLLNYEKEISSISLFIPYLPFARQDRECAQGDPFSLSVFSEILNRCKFSKVTVLDVHSEVAFNYIHNLKNITFTFHMPSFYDYIIISPDEGSRNRCNDFLHVHSKNEIINLTYKRNK